jgi:pentatricopeptide repeat protein
MPNNYTFATAANACASLTDLDEGRKVRGYVIKLGDDSDVGVNNALIDMYAKCGSVACAHKVFQSMQQRPVISWNGRAGCHGQAHMRCLSHGRHSNCQPWRRNRPLQGSVKNCFSQILAAATNILQQ